MTLTNRAFIKAYRKDDAQPTPAAPASAAAARQVQPVAARAATPASAASTVSAERSALYGPAPSAVAPNAPISGRAEKRPLSSFIASTGIARPNKEPAENDFFRPGTTVASFEWPAVCRRLLRDGGAELDRVGDALLSHAGAGRSLVGVVGLAPQDGATTIALCLAMRLADRRRPLILVDGNFARPRLAPLLGAESTVGWQDVLAHGAPLSDAAIRATSDRVDVLALAEKMPADMPRLVSGLQAVVTAGVLRHAYEHVLFDLGAFSHTGVQPVLWELVRNMGIDAVVAVTSAGAATHDVDQLAEQLSRTGCEFLGIIENRTGRGQESRVKSQDSFA